MTNQYALPDGNSIPIEYYEYIVKVTRNQLANNLEREATRAMISDEYNFNDTAVRAKTFYLAAQLVRGDND
jgi:hypothetical protein